MSTNDQGQHSDDAALSPEAFGPPLYDSPDFPQQLAQASDEFVRLPLWEFRPVHRPAVLHERARRWGLPTDDDFDVLYH